MPTSGNPSKATLKKEGKEKKAYAVFLRHVKILEQLHLIVLIFFLFCVFVWVG